MNSTSYSDCSSILSSNSAEFVQGIEIDNLPTNINSSDNNLNAVTNKNVSSSKEDAIVSVKCPFCHHPSSVIYKYCNGKRRKCSIRSCKRWFGDVIVGGKAKETANLSTTVAKSMKVPSKIAQKSPETRLSLLSHFDCSTKIDSSSQTESLNLVKDELNSKMDNLNDEHGNSLNFLKRKLKMAELLLKQSREKCNKYECEKNLAIASLRKIPDILQKYKNGFVFEKYRIHEDQNILISEYETYIKEVSRGVEKERIAIDQEKMRVNKMFEYCDKKRTDLKAQLECKKEQLKQSQHETSMASRRCDTLIRDAHLAIVESQRATRSLNDKLFLGSNQKCGSCTANERVRNVLASQIVEKSNDNVLLKKERDELYKKCEAKEKICKILSKDNQRISFEMKALSEDNKRMFENNRKIVERDEQLLPSTSGSMTGQYKQKSFISVQSNPSSSTSDKSIDTIGSERKLTQSISAGFSTRKGPRTPPDPLPSSMEDGQKVDEQQMDVDDVQQNDQKAGRFDDSNWLLGQLRGCWTLLEWYRKELKHTIDQRRFCMDRLEEDDERFECQERKLMELRKELNEEKQGYHQLQKQVQTLTQSVSSYFASNPDG